MRYRLISCSTTVAIIQFPGKFNNRKVIWHAQIRILNTKTKTPANKSCRQYINVTDQNNKLKAIEIGLNLQEISRPDILKTIIMIRKYKKLKTGKHEFGPLFFY